MMLFLVKTFAAVIFIGILIFCIFLSLAYKSSRDKSRMIEELCLAPMETSVSEVIEISQKIGFKFDRREFAIPSVVEVTDDDAPSRDHLPVGVSNGKRLSNFKNGKLNFGLSLFLFERKGCELTFSEGKVISTRTWYLD